MSPRLVRFDVVRYSAERNEVVRGGQVLLPVLASRREVEHALAAAGLYCPRGMDRLVWRDVGDAPSATIYDASGVAIARLSAVSIRASNGATTKGWVRR